MVRNYVRKTNRQQWDEDAMAMAVQAVLSREMSALKAAQMFNVPATTLHRYARKKKEDTDFQINKSQGKFISVFSPEQEEELVSYLKSMESWFDGLTMKDVRALAYQLAERHGLGHRFFNNSGMAGQDWVKGFLARHPVFMISKTGSKSKGFDIEAVADFCSKHQLTGQRIFSCDGSGISVSPGKRSRMLPLKGERLVGGETVTAVMCMSAAGSFMPPMLVFPSRESNDEYEMGLPPGGWCKPHPSGWMTNELFLAWFEKFVEFSGAKKESPVLLMLDGLSLYTKNLLLIEKARESGVALLCLPPQTAHRFQPLEVTFLRQLSDCYTDEAGKWLRNNPERGFTLSRVSPIFGAAFLRAALPENAIDGFKVSGIWPVDRSMFLNEDSTISDESESPVPCPDDSPSDKTGYTSEVLISEDLHEESKPGCSSWASK